MTVKTRAFVLVGTNSGYETSVIRVYTDEALANSGKRECERYQDKKPKWYDESDKSDAAFETYSKKLELWEKRHPAGQAGRWSDEFFIIPTILVQ